MRYKAFVTSIALLLTFGLTAACEPLTVTPQESPQVIEPPQELGPNPFLMERCSMPFPEQDEFPCVWEYQPGEFVIDDGESYRFVYFGDFLGCPKPLFPDLVYCYPE